MAEQQSVDVQAVPGDQRALLQVARSMIGPIRYAPLAVSAIAAVPAAMAGWALATYVLHFDNGAASIVAGLLAYIVYFTVCSRLGQIVVRRSYLPGGSFLTPKRIVASAEGLYVEAEDFRAELNWKAVKKIAETPTHLVVMLDVMSGYIIPKRCFRDAQAQADFLSAARSFIGHAT